MPRYDEAIEQYRKTPELGNHFFLARLWLGKSYEQKGRYKEAIQEFQNAMLSEDDPSDFIT
jgi:tetratricopeptide (TPR) repeat protein